VISLAGSFGLNPITLAPSPLESSRGNGNQSSSVVAGVAPPLLAYIALPPRVPPEYATAISVASGPGGFTYIGINYANPDETPFLAKCNNSLQLVGTFAIGGNNQAVFTPLALYWVLTFPENYSGTLGKYDKDTGAFVANVWHALPEDGYPRGVAFSASLNILYVTSDTKIFVLDATTEKVITTYTGFHTLSHLAIDSKGNLLAAGRIVSGSVTKSVIYVVNTATGAIIQTLSIPGNSGFGVCVHPSGTIYATLRILPGVAVYDADYNFLESFPIPGFFPNGCSVHDDKLYVTNWEFVYVFDVRGYNSWKQSQVLQLHN